MSPSDSAPADLRDCTSLIEDAKEACLKDKDVSARLNREFAADGVLIHTCVHGDENKVDLARSGQDDAPRPESFSFLRHDSFPRALTPVYGLEGFVMLPRDVRILCAFPRDAATTHRWRCGCGDPVKGTVSAMILERDCAATLTGKVSSARMCPVKTNRSYDEAGNPLEPFSACYDGTEFASAFVPDFTLAARNHSEQKSGGQSCQMKPLWSEVRAMMSRQMIIARVFIDMAYVNLPQKSWLKTTRRCSGRTWAGLEVPPSAPRVYLHIRQLLGNSMTPFSSMAPTLPPPPLPPPPPSPPSPIPCYTDPPTPGMSFPCFMPYREPRLTSHGCTANVMKVAHCSAGLARSFTQPVVYRSFRRNLLDAFGGRSATFLYLKTFDAVKKDRENRFPADAAEDRVPRWDEQQKEQLRQALHFVQPQCVQLVHDESLEYNPRCNLGNSSNDTSAGSYTTPAGLARHVGQLQSSMACLRMIEHHEANHSIRFDLVTRMRPDLAFLYPMEPYCMYMSQLFSRLHQQRIALIDKKDYLYIMTRRDATPLLSLLNIYHSCVGDSYWEGSQWVGNATPIYEALLRLMAHRGSISMHHPTGGFGIGLVNPGARCEGSCSKTRQTWMPPPRKAMVTGCCVDSVWVQCSSSNEWRCDQTLKSPHFGVGADGAMCAGCAATGVLRAPHNIHGAPAAQPHGQPRNQAHGQPSGNSTTASSECSQIKDLHRRRACLG